MSPDPFWLSLRYAGLATLLAVPPGILLAHILARRRFPGRDLLDAAANLPIAVPPAVLVYYLLAASGRWPAAFHWSIAVALSTIYTLPLFLRTARAGFETVDHSIENAARLLGASEWRVFWRITAPLAWRPLVAATLAGLARAVADFGITGVVAGSMQDALRTTVLLLLVGTFALAALYTGNRLQRRQDAA
jgi:molybdate transport system permease protein